MSEKFPYSFTILRYRHDGISGEQVNVGVLLHCAKSGYLAVKVRKTYSRLTSVFPDLDGEAFRDAMRTVERSLRKLQAERELLLASTDAIGVAKRILPHDDSSLQWSPLMGGLTSDPAETHERTFARMVTKYDVGVAERRKTDEDVWRPIHQALEERHLAGQLSETRIVGRTDSIDFKHAWKNGVWHCYQPVSFDLADGDHIKDKARRWTGHLNAVADAKGEFRPYFIVAMPRDLRLKPAFKNAIAILKTAPIQPEIYTEDRTEELVDTIEDEIRTHDQRGS